MRDRTRQALTSALLLGCVAVLGSALLAGVHALTRDRIAEQEQRMVQRRLDQVLPAGAYDNQPWEDRIELTDPAFRGQPRPVLVYRARDRGAPVAVALDHVAPDGYNGAIRLLTGIRADGTVSAVRVISHRETPGLGDPIEIERSDWIHGFDGRSLSDPDPAGWAVRKDGGRFDQFTGATITPRAVVEAVRQALEYHRRHRDRLYRPRQEAPAND